MADDWMDDCNTEGPDGASRPPTTSEAAASACMCSGVELGTYIIHHDQIHHYQQIHH